MLFKKVKKLRLILDFIPARDDDFLIEDFVYPAAASHPRRVSWMQIVNHNHRRREQ